MVRVKESIISHTREDIQVQSLNIAILMNPMIENEDEEIVMKEERNQGRDPDPQAMIQEMVRNTKEIMENQSIVT